MANVQEAYRKEALQNYKIDSEGTWLKVSLGGTSETSISGGTMDYLADLAGVDVIANSAGTYLRTVAKLDDVSGAETVIDYAHHEIHEGDHYFIEDFQTLGSGAEINFVVISGTVQNHMLFDIQSTGQTEFYSYKLGSVDSDGTQIFPQNSNTSSSKTCDTCVYKDPTVADYGTKMNSQSFGLETNPSKIIGGGVRSESELVLGTGGTFIYRIKSQSPGNIVTYHGNWYNHGISVV